jgi:hypothetical protein
MGGWDWLSIAGDPGVIPWPDDGAVAGAVSAGAGLVGLICANAEADASNDSESAAAPIFNTVFMTQFLLMLSAPTAGASFRWGDAPLNEQTLKRYSAEMVHPGFHIAQYLEPAQPDRMK